MKPIGLCRGLVECSIILKADANLCVPCSNMNGEDEDGSGEGLREREIRMNQNQNQNQNQNERDQNSVIFRHFAPNPLFKVLKDY